MLKDKCKIEDIPFILPKTCTIISAKSAEIIVCVCLCESACPVAPADGTGVAK